MPGSRQRNGLVFSDWDTYWRGTSDVAAYSAGGVHHAEIEAFWRDSLPAVFADNANPACLDIGSGVGAVVDKLLAHNDAISTSMHCLDVSPAAIAAIKERYPQITGIVADAADIPLPDRRFDLVTSQFGIEYAEFDAFNEAARLVRAGGHLIFLLHYRDGRIYRECSATLEAVNRLVRSRFIPLALQFFEAGFAAARGADRGPYDAAGRALAPAVREVEAIVADFGPDVAGETIVRLYEDVGRIHGEIQHYDPDEVLGWLHRMEEELGAYAGRMASMRKAALDRAALDRVVAVLRSAGLEITAADALTDRERNEPLAWRLQARRPAAGN